jgi:hypothetical protein
MPFDGESKTDKREVRFGYDPEAAEQAFRKSARDTIAALDHLAPLFDGGRHWIRNKDRDENGSFCPRGDVTHIAGEHPGRHADYYLKVAIRGLVGRSMTIPAFNDSALNFASIAYVISRARELAVAVADGTRA